MTYLGRIALLGLFVLTAVSLGAEGVKAQSFSFGFNAGRCETDDEVAEGDRAAYEGPALNFVRALLGLEPSNAYAAVTVAMKQATTPEAFAAFVRTNVGSLGSIGNLHVAHSYYLTGMSTGTGQYHVLCTTVAHGSFSVPEGRVLVAATSAPEQAHVIVEGDTRNNTFAFVLWLLPEQGQWRVQNLHLTATAMVGKSALEFWSLARSASTITISTPMFFTRRPCSWRHAALLFNSGFKPRSRRSWDNSKSRGNWKERRLSVGNWMGRRFEF